jgi:cell division protein FtsI (penicillin-binding protein 3)
MMNLLDTKNEFRKRISIVTIGVVLFAIVLVFRIFQIAIVQQSFWKQISARSFSKKLIEGDRGNILTEKGELLAYTESSYEIAIDPCCIDPELFDKEVDSFAIMASKYTGESPWNIKKKLIDARNSTPKKTYIRLKEDVSINEKNEWIKFPLFRNGQFKGGYNITTSSKRAYPYPGIATRTIGYNTDKNEVGLESTYDNVLRGGHDSVMCVRQPRGILKPINDTESSIPDKGKDIVTTLDLKLQEITHNELLNGLKFHNAEKGCAIIMETKTGKIKAMTNLTLTEGEYKEVYNHAIGTSTEPGSTFKLASIMAILEEGSVTLEDTVDIEKGKTKFFREVMEDHEFSGNSKITLRRAFEISSNVGIAKTITKVFENKKDKFFDLIKGFDIDKATNIDLKGERIPYIKNPNNVKDNWSDVTLPWMSIGYESQLTPLKILTFYNAIANDGVMVQPYLTSATIDKNGKEHNYGTVILNSKIAHSSTIKAVKSLLEGVVDSGTAKYINHDKKGNYSFAGKTGTAQMEYLNKKSADFGHQASFVGYFPADKPEYTCIIVVYKPKENGYYGAGVAGKIFTNITDKCFATCENLSLNYDNKKQILTNGMLPRKSVGNTDDISKILHKVGQKIRIEKKDKKAMYGELSANVDTLFMKQRVFRDNMVPNVVGMGLKDALYILENLGLKVRFSGVGKIKNQSVSPGARIDNQVIHLQLN